MNVEIKSGSITTMLLKRLRPKYNNNSLLHVSKVNVSIIICMMDGDVFGVCQRERDVGCYGSKTCTWQMRSALLYNNVCDVCHNKKYLLRYR